jgi:hypothetical protein
MITPGYEGTFVVGAYIPTNAETLITVSLALNDNEEFIVRIKTEHDRCAYDKREFTVQTQQLKNLREWVWGLWDTLDLPGLEIVRSTGKKSLSVGKRVCENFDQATEVMLDTIDALTPHLVGDEEFMQITPEFLESGKSSNDGWSAAQLECLGVKWPPEKGDVTEKYGTYIPKRDYLEFLRLKDEHLLE